MAFSRLKGDRRLGWYDNPFRDGRGFASAIYEEGAAYPDAVRNRGTAADKAVAFVAIVLNEKSDRQPFRSLPGRCTGSQSCFWRRQEIGADQSHHFIGSSECCACQEEQAPDTDHDGMRDAAEWAISFARSCPHAASMSNPREYRTDVGIPDERKMPEKCSIPAGSGRS
jgi:hypothetical protein